MRRLAKNSRNDQVRSTRDYQEILTRAGTVFVIDPRRPSRLVFSATLDAQDGGFVGVGGFIRSDAEVELLFTVRGGEALARRFHSRVAWGRFGLVLPYTGEEKLAFHIESEGSARELHVWGLEAGIIQLPEGATIREEVTPRLLGAPHLAPETFFFSHDVALAMDAEVEEWENASPSDAHSPISVKKCAYCQRLLPIDRSRPNALSFHKHNAKISGHQNECRACKKWRINNAFNPDRTTDQLHESSVITRERKLFLREPIILQRIKDREGDGLKSIVWERFGRKCFRCGRPLAISEVELDHTRPMAYLWPIDQYATCLCSTCNNYKKDRFPIDVYSEAELRRLAELTGLAYGDLVRKEVNQDELERICADIVGFAREWDPRTFNATARKVRELHPEIDLFTYLLADDPEEHARLISELAERPPTAEA